MELRTRPKHPILPSKSFKDSTFFNTNKGSKVRLMYLGSSSKKVKCSGRRDEKRGVVHCSSSFPSSAGSGVEAAGKGGEGKIESGHGHFGNLVSEFGWRVRRLVEEEVEMRMVAQVQAEAFHAPVALFNDLFFEFFKAEVLSGLVYKLRSSPADRYACLIAEPTSASGPCNDLKPQLVGVVDVTVLRDQTVLNFLEGAEEYLYVSGIAVLEEFRRKKVGTVLLKACDLLSLMWGFEYLVLRAYEDDAAALRLYTNAGYKIVSGDPHWTTSWIGKRRRVLMIKGSSNGLR